MKLQKPQKLWTILAGFFIANALLAEFLGVKIFSLEKTFGFNPSDIKLGDSNFNFDLTAGVIIWPAVFINTDINNDFYGKKAVKFLSYLAAGILAFSFLVVTLVIKTVPSQYWTSNFKGISDINGAYNAIFGQGLWIIAGSIIAFLVGQVVDAVVFERIKRKTSGKGIWLRATVSTLISQFIDSYLVLIIAFYVGQGFDLKWVLQIGTMNYFYKFIVAICLIPLLYVIHHTIDKFLGKSLSEQMKKDAMVV